MADVVSDGLEGEVGIHEPLHAGVPEGVRTRPGNLDTNLAEIMPAPGGDRSLADRGPRGHCSEEDATVLRLRPSVLEVIEYGIANDRRERIGSRVPRLAFGDSQPVVAPVNIIQR